MGSPMPEYPDTQESDNINVDAHEKDGEHVPVLDRKRKRERFVDEELSVFKSMTEVVKEVATAIRGSKSTDVHPHLYGAIMEQTGFSLEALMVALSHLLDNKS
ncbi:Histone-lysine N-methyltransferase SUVR5 [Hordeum vulgare]|nr:Histone-lysine N-methyltransferase SUVR5 [Hordeum vulgare]